MYVWSLRSELCRLAAIFNLASALFALGIFAFLASYYPRAVLPYLLGSAAYLVLAGVLFHRAPPAQADVDHFAGLATGAAPPPPDDDWDASRTSINVINPATGNVMLDDYDILGQPEGSAPIEHTSPFG